MGATASHTSDVVIYVCADIICLFKVCFLQFGLCV
jgi:hypothetical protein